MPMTKSEAQKYVASQFGGDAVHLAALLKVEPTTLAGWVRVAEQYGHCTATEIRRACVATGAVTAVQT